jgi:hypothetical protein
MTSPHQSIVPESQFDLLRRSRNVSTLPRLGRFEKQLAGARDGCAVGDIREALKEQRPHVAQRLKTGSVFKYQCPAQFFLPVHAAIVAHSNPGVQQGAAR